jgi:hypothetical protein
MQQNLRNITNLGLRSNTVIQNKKQRRHEDFFLVFDEETLGKTEM